MSLFLTQVWLAAPLFLLLLGSYCFMKLFRCSSHPARILTAIAFRGALPILLFHTMSRFSQASFDLRVLSAFFGGCVLVFILGTCMARWLGASRDAGAVMGIGGVFSNNAMLGLPLASLALGPRSVPTVALVLVFNALVLWTLVTVAIEGARQGKISVGSLVTTLRKVAVNPIIVAIVLGLVWDLLGLSWPAPVETSLGLLAQAAGPLSLIALGLGLGEYKLGRERRLTLALVVLKLVFHPLAVWALAVALELPSLETKTVVLLASTAMGANVGLMARQFQVLEGPTSQALLLSTLLSAVTTPLFLALIG